MRPEIKEVVDKTVQEEIAQEQKEEEKEILVTDISFGSSTFTIGLFVCIGFLLFIVLGQGIGKKKRKHQQPSQVMA